MRDEGSLLVVGSSEGFSPTVWLENKSHIIVLQHFKWIFIFLNDVILE